MSIRDAISASADLFRRVWPFVAQPLECLPELSSIESRADHTAAELDRLLHIDQWATRRNTKAQVAISSRVHWQKGHPKGRNASDNNGLTRRFRCSGREAEHFAFVRAADEPVALKPHLHIEVYFDDADDPAARVRVFAARTDDLTKVCEDFRRDYSEQELERMTFLRKTVDPNGLTQFFSTRHTNYRDRGMPFFECHVRPKPLKGPASYHTVAGVLVAVLSDRDSKDLWRPVVSNSTPPAAAARWTPYQEGLFAQARAAGLTTCAFLPCEPVAVCVFGRCRKDGVP